LGDTTTPEKVNLTSDYDVPRIIVGAWQFSAGHNLNPAGTENAIDTLSAFFDAGFSTFDCADIYTGVEELLGEWLRRRAALSDSKLNNIRIHTKFVPDRDALRDITKSYTESIIDRSLRRLGVEQLDLVQFSWWDYRIPGYVETANWLHELQLKGKIRLLGVTNFDVPRMREICDSGVPVVSHQVQYSLLDHRPEHGLVDFCRERDIKLLCYGTLAGGFLSERWLGKAEPAETLSNRSLTKYKLMIDEFGGWGTYQALLEELANIAAKHDVDIATIATRYVLQQAQVAAAIVGARRREHLNANRRVLSVELDQKDIARMRSVALPRSPKGDVFDLERVPGSTHAAIMRYNLNRD
jgi:aryl-alcohol dehydrogenase-like predicted oxidoreductase